MDKLIDISCYPVVQVLDLLLADKSTKKPIIWATDSYEAYGQGFTDKEPVKAEALLVRRDSIRPRIQKSQEAQAQRTRKKAEVFTPAWLCNRMNNHCDEDWFGRPDVFNQEQPDHSWTVTEGKIAFPEGKTWQAYVDSRRLEITCGEAPYLVSRYDTSTGDLIIPPIRRIGILDRKLRIVNENTETYADWLKWTFRAFEASYGYEYQGDNVLIARINLILTFLDYHEDRWGERPDDRLLEKLANRIAWNIWQMDGLKGTVPLGKPYEAVQQISFFDAFRLGEESGAAGASEAGGAAGGGQAGGSAGADGVGAGRQADPLKGGPGGDLVADSVEEPEALPCRIYNWRSKASLDFMKVRGRQTMGKKLFDYVIGNPPYNEDFSDSGDNGKFAKPVYNLFMDASYTLADKVELIHPARFLFNAGSTPTAWNKKMLNDKHFKILDYEADGTKVFPNTDIKGGVAVSYHDENRDYGAIGTFIPYEELKNILAKVELKGEPSFSNIIVSSYSYHFSKILYEDHPELLGKMSKGHDFDLKANVFQRLPQIFFDQKPDDGQEYAGIYGLDKTKRTLKYVRRAYINDVDNFEYFKVFVPAANGSGALGEPLATPLIGPPLIGHTESFISIGHFSNEAEANACMKYVKTKFARCLLGVLKVTQHNPPEKWKYVPLQDFTAASDIDWSKSIDEINLQLYRKYGLNKKEIQFIETHVKEMA